MLDIKLRRWQLEAITAALKKIESDNPHFLCLATPGAGKTLMSSIVARYLIDSGQIDLVLCFSPSINISTAFQSSLEQHLECRLDGRLGSKGLSLTYQSMLNMDRSFWSLLSQNRTLVIFDEIHHCSGDDLESANAWGQTIIRHIQGKAAFTLALTGTPWRSDKIPIAMSSYCHQGKIQCDYTYGLGQAIKDHVCRTPKITAVDNENIQLRTASTTEKYTSIEDLLKRSNSSYQHLLASSTLIAYLIKLSAKKLDQIRRHQSDAGGLIVAASVEHALKISDILSQETGEEAYIATYMHDDAHDAINHFREANAKWIISVGMISEGTDIPRLRVCCHLTRVKTELYFRQVLGRILRSNGNSGEEGYLFMPAEPSLVEYAHRVAEDIPKSNTVVIQPMGPTPLLTDDLGLDITDVNDPDTPNDFDVSVGLPSPSSIDSNTDEDIKLPPTFYPLPEAYDATIGLFGRFRQQVISLATSGISQ